MATSEDEPALTVRLTVFVSYSRADSEFAGQLVLALEDKGFDPLSIASQSRIRRRGSPVHRLTKAI